MRSFATREACLNYFQEQFPTLPPYLIELAMDFDLGNPDVDPANLRNSITPEARKLAEQMEAEQRQYTEDECLQQGIIFDDPDDVPEEPLAPGVVPGEALSSDDEDDSDAEYPKSLQYHPRDKNLLGSNTTTSSDEDTNSDSDTSSEDECATLIDQLSTTD